MKYKLYYNPRHDIIGLDFGEKVVKISETKEFMVLTKEWIYIGVL